MKAVLFISIEASPYITYLHIIYIIIIVLLTLLMFVFVVHSVKARSFIIAQITSFKKYNRIIN